MGDFSWPCLRGCLGPQLDQRPRMPPWWACEVTPGSPRSSANSTVKRFGEGELFRYVVGLRRSAVLSGNSTDTGKSRAATLTGCAGHRLTGKNWEDLGLDHGPLGAGFC